MKPGHKPKTAVLNEQQTQSETPKKDIDAADYRKVWIENVNDRKYRGR